MNNILTSLAIPCINGVDLMINTTSNPTYTITTSPPTSTVVGGTPKKTRNWTGKPRGRTPAQKDEFIRKRISYQDFVKQAQQFRKQGIQWDTLSFILRYFHNCKRQWRGYRYSSNGYWAEQSLELFLEDINNYDKREELGLN